MPILTIVIVNFNGRRFLADCLDSIARQVSCAHEIIVVDNGSSDDSVAFLRQAYPQVILIENGENLGFAAGNNLGVEHGRGEFLLLLNNDTILLTDVAEGVRLLSVNRNFGIVSAKMLDGEKTWRSSTGWFPSPLRLVKFASLIHPISYLLRAGKENSTCCVDWAQGSFLLMRTDTFKSLQGFDENYFMYVEDVDLCKRIADAGLKTVFSSELNYIHFGGFDSSRWNLLYKGFQRYHRKFSSPLVKGAALLILALGKVARRMLYSKNFAKATKASV